MNKNQKNFTELRNKLLAEKKLLKNELGAVGRRNPDNPEDWEAVPPETEGEGEPDKNIAADMIEGFEEAVSIEGELEQRLFQITSALNRMEAGTYGTCLVCKKEIEAERLAANGAATTCIEHKNNK